MKVTTALIVVLACAAPAAAQKAPGESPAKLDVQRDHGWSFTWHDHPEVEWSGQLRVEFHARVQADRRTSEAAIERGTGDGFDVGRRRLGIEGEIGPRVEFQIEGELEKEDPWRDVYLNYRALKVAQVQAGQFKLPFGLEETTGATKLDFIYRSLVSTRLAPGRDTGVMVHGRLANRTLGYEAGMFAHDGDNARPSGGNRVFGGRTIAARLTAEPFRRSKSRLADVQLGVAVTRSTIPEGFPGLRGRTVLGVSFFDSDLWVRGHRRRAGVQLRWRPGPFSFSSEYIRVSDDRRGQSLEGADLTPFLARGWYVSGTWVVAGASAPARVSEPRRPLFEGGFGSIQLAARLEQLGFGSAVGLDPPSTSQRASSILGNRERATTLGLAWHPNRWIAIEGNAIREAIGQPGRDPVPHTRFWTRLVRFQLAI